MSFREVRVRMKLDAFWRCTHLMKGMMKLMVIQERLVSLCVVLSNLLKALLLSQF